MAQTKNNISHYRRRTDSAASVRDPLRGLSAEMSAACDKWLRDNEDKKPDNSR